MKIIWLSFILSLCIFCPNNSIAQWRWVEDGNKFLLGGQIGITFNVGTHTHRIGISAKIFACYDFLQINTQFIGSYNFKTWATKQKGWELQSRLGIVGAWGKRDSLLSPFINDVSHQTGRRYSIGYGFNIYRDTWKTSQITGSFGFQIRRAIFVIENDFLSGISHDRYRTGTLGLYYWHKPTQTQLGFNHISWTGDPYTGNVPWIRDDEKFPARFGYKDMSQALLGRFSMGILAFNVQQAIPLHQTLDASIGIDAEEIRNLMQNKFIHDSPISPANWGSNEEGKNPHIPMLDIDGAPYLYKNGQEIRPARFFFQFGANNSLFY